MHPGALCERGVQIPVAHKETKAHSSQSLRRGRTPGRTQRRPLPGSRTWPWILISGRNVLPSRSLQSQHSPGDSGEAPGERQPPSASHRAFCHQVPPRRGQWPCQHLTLPPWMGKCSVQPVLEAEVPPVPRHRGQARGGPRESPSGQLEGPARPQTHRRAPPSWAFHMDAINTTVQKCNKHKATKQTPISKLERNAGPPSRNASCWNGSRFIVLCGCHSDVF